MLSVYIIFPEKVYHFYFKHIIGAKVTDLVVLIASHIHGIARGWRHHQSELHADLLALWQLNGLLTVAEDDVESAACGRREGGSEAVGA